MCFWIVVQLFHSKAYWKSQSTTLLLVFHIVCNNHTDYLLHSPHLWSSGPQKCSACIKEDLFEEPVSILKQGGVSISSFSTYWLGWSGGIHGSVVALSLDSCGAKCICGGCVKACKSTSVCLCRLFLTMQLGEKWKPWQLFVPMKDARGREQLKNLRYMIYKKWYSQILHWFRLFHTLIWFVICWYNWNNITDQGSGEAPFWSQIAQTSAS